MAASLSPPPARPDGARRVPPCVPPSVTQHPFPSSPPRGLPAPPGPPSSTPLVCKAACVPSSGPPGALLNGPSRASMFEDFRHSRLLGWLQGGLKMITGPPGPALPSLEATTVGGGEGCSSSRTTWCPGRPGTQGFTEPCPPLPTLGRSTCSLPGTPCTHPALL